MTFSNTISKRAFGASVLAAAFLLQGCEPAVPEYFQEVDVVATQQAATTQDRITTQACNATTLQWMVGQPQAVIAGIELAGPVRIIGPNQSVTADVDRTRTNFYIDVAGRITRVTCG